MNGALWDMGVLCEGGILVYHIVSQRRINAAVMVIIGSRNGLIPELEPNYYLN